MSDGHVNFISLYRIVVYLCKARIFILFPNCLYGISNKLVVCFKLSLSTHMAKGMRVNEKKISDCAAFHKNIWLL